MKINRQMKMLKKSWIWHKKVRSQQLTLNPLSELRALRQRGSKCLPTQSNSKRESIWWGKEEPSTLLLKLSYWRLIMKLLIKHMKSMSCNEERLRLILNSLMSPFCERGFYTVVLPQIPSFVTMSISTWRMHWDSQARKIRNFTFLTSTACNKRKVVPCSTLRPKEVRYLIRTILELCLTKRLNRKNMKSSMKMNLFHTWKI